ncbi:MAG: hypothetical protein ACE5FD_03900 [Anaerolineae bacterium]
MKTAISLPDSIFERAERFAQLFGLNRSQLFTRALQEYLDKYDPVNITASFDKIYAVESSELDPVLAQMQTLSLADDEW